MFRDGEDFEQLFDTPRGLIQVFAECHVLGSHLVLDELLFYPAEDSKRVHLGVNEVLAIFRELRLYAARASFTEITIVYHHRLSPSQRWPVRAYNKFHEEPSMKTLPVPPIAPHIESQVRKLFAAATPVPEIIQEMRSLGLNMIASIKLLRSYGGISTANAKDLVHRSEAWADCLETHEALHDAAEQAARQAGFVEETITA